VFPIGGRVSQFVGEEGSLKSGLAIEHGRWFIDLGGIVQYREHESKYSPEWTASIIGWERQKNFLVHKCHSLEDWQISLTDMAKDIQSFMVPESGKGPGAVFPVLDIVDSILAKSSEGSQEKISKAGHASREWGVDALLLTKYMQSYPQTVAGWPFHLILINHLKLSENEGRTIRGKPGGKNKDFQESFEVQSSKGQKIQLESGIEGVNINLQTFKNSLGTTGRYIQVPVRWWDEEAPERPSGFQQRTVWDWAECTLRMLADGTNLPNTKYSAVKEALDLHLIKGSRKAFSKRLGISKDSPLSYEEASQVLHADTQLVASFAKSWVSKSVRYSHRARISSRCCSIPRKRQPAITKSKGSGVPERRRNQPNPNDDESPAQQFLNDLSAKDFEGLNERRFEGALVEKILKRYKSGAAMRAQLWQSTPRDQGLTFDAFWQEFPGAFPIYLVCRRIGKIAEDMTLQRLVDRFARLKVVKALVEAQDEFPEDVAGGVAFFWPWLKHKTSVTTAGGVMVLHQWDQITTCEKVPGLNITYVDPDVVPWHISPLGYLLDCCAFAGTFDR
jgi:hypothetical protein